MAFFDLTGHTAVVTGAATGIGEAVVRRLAAAGASVAAVDLDMEGAARVAGDIAGGPGRLVFAVRADISSAESVNQAVAEVLDRTGRIDVLVNNAGIAGRAAPLWEQTVEDWQRVIAVNMNGVFHCCRAVINHMRERHYGRIVNVASIAGKEGNPNMTGYSSTKAAVIAFTKSLAKEVATEGICVNSVAPAVVRTRILDQLTPAQIEYMTARIPMRRTGTPDEIAAVIHFLASPDCSFVTGQCYDASGGRATY
ncbi:MAG TPA: SDR family NAD(P)-dependent oxidoreductase [Bryobacteraceae bacterium]|nr:SDR family NAD(P)-dependent oxidoreductase [Bryobacteraceae bacterium]